MSDQQPPSAAIIRIPPNRLAKLLKRPGGITIAKAVAAARENLQSIRQDCLAKTGEAVQQMRLVIADANLTPAARRAELYRLSNEVFGSAGALEMGPLSEASYSLCEALDRMSGADRWHLPTIEVHLASIVRLLSADGNPEMCIQIIAGLRQVAQRQ